MYLKSRNLGRRIHSLSLFQCNSKRLQSRDASSPRQPRVTKQYTTVHILSSHLRSRHVYKHVKILFNHEEAFIVQGESPVRLQVLAVANPILSTFWYTLLPEDEDWWLRSCSSVLDWNFSMWYTLKSLSLHTDFLDGRLFKTTSSVTGHFAYLIGICAVCNSFGEILLLSIFCSTTLTFLTLHPDTVNSDSETTVYLWSLYHSLVLQSCKWTPAIFKNVQTRAYAKIISCIRTDGRFLWLVFDPGQSE